MASQIESGRMNYRDIPELKEYFLNGDLRRTGTILGSGVFGVVEELRVGGAVCVGKRLHASLLGKGVDQRYISSCKIMSKLCHPNIVPLMGLCEFTECPHPVVVREKLHGNVETIISTFKSVFPLPLSLCVFKDVVKGLIYLHNQNPPVVHRNLTARNIFINKNTLTAKIGDTEDALIADPERFSISIGHAPATLPYMPPEVLYNKPYHNNCCMLDIFSFGHLALVTIIQKFPMTEDLLPSIYQDQLSELPRARTEVQRREVYIDMLVKKLTKEHKLTGLILQCLHDMPRKRYTHVL